MIDFNSFIPFSYRVRGEPRNDDEEALSNGDGSGTGYLSIGHESGGISWKSDGDGSGDGYGEENGDGYGGGHNGVVLKGLIKLKGEK